MDTNTIRKLPYPVDGGRVESGAIQFGDDWPALHLRGDDAWAIAAAIGAVLHDFEPKTFLQRIAADQLRGLQQTIEEDVTVKPKVTQTGD